MASPRAVNQVAAQDPSPRTPADMAVAAATALGLVAWNNLVAAHPWHARHYVLGNLMGTAALLTLAKLRGVSADELGLSPQRIAAGARAGAALAAPIVGFWAAAMVSPHGSRLRDARLVGMTPRTITYQAVVRVPIGTALWEETAFRAVLPALLRRAMPGQTAGAANALLFGLWHVRPALEAMRLNGIPTTRPKQGAAVAGAIVATALVDALLSAFQRSSGSLLTPTLVHVASNSGGTVAASRAGRRDQTGPAGG